MIKKIKNNKGFTLVEMLVCVLTLLLVGAICATGTRISVKSYQESRFESDSQMLQSTIDMVLGDLFRYATTIKEVDGQIVFSSSNYEMNNGTIQIENIGDHGESRFSIKKTTGASPILLIGESVYAENLYVSDFVLTYDSSTRVFSGSYNIKSTIINDAERTCQFTYRSIAEW